MNNQTTNSSKPTTDNYRKHTTKNPLQKFLINRFFSRLIKEAKLTHAKTILDVGCGEGITLHKLRKADIGKDLVGVDFSKVALEIGKKQYAKLDLRHGTIYKLPFKDNSFDLVLCLEVLEHLDNPEEALRELARVSKKYAIISVPNEPFFMLSNFFRGKNLSRWGNDIEHINHWSMRRFKKFVSKEFHIVDAHYPYPWQMLILKK